MVVTAIRMMSRITQGNKECPRNLTWNCGKTGIAQAQISAVLCTVKFTVDAFTSSNICELGIHNLSL